MVEPEKAQAGDLSEASIVAAFAGGAPTAALLLALTPIVWTNGLLSGAGIVLMALLPVTAFATLAWLLGICVVGLPAWWGLDRLGFRGRPVAMSAGALLSSAPVLLFAPVAGVAVTDVWVWFVISLGSSGAIAGLAFEGVAYRGWRILTTRSVATSAARAPTGMT